MPIPEKDVSLHVFTGNVDSDTAPDLFPQNKARYMLNTRIFQNGTKSVVVNLLGNILIANSLLPSGNNIGLGYGVNEEKGKLYYFNYNDQGYHGIYVYDIVTQSISPVIQNLIDTNNVDIFGFSPDYTIEHVDIVSDVLIYWVDGLNKARKFNINKAIDKTSTGYGTVILEDYITAYKKTAVYAPTLIYTTDLTRNNNYMYGLQVKAAVRFYYDDNEISNWSDWSGVPFPPNESFLGQDSISFDNNCVLITFETGSKLVVKIEIGILLTSTVPTDGGSLPWVSVVTLNKAQLAIQDNATYTYNFYNDGSYGATDQTKIFRPFSFLPSSPKAQSFLKLALCYTNFTEGFETVTVSGNIVLSFNAFYLPSGTISQLNSPSIIITQTSVVHHGGSLLGNSYYTTLTHFIVGEDVKKGNKFTVNAFGGNGPKTFTYTALIGDSATTVASLIKAWLTGISSVGAGVVSNETTTGDGDAAWDFSIEAHEGKNAISFSGSVTAVNYSTLLDNGLSLNSIKMGSVIKYAIVYEDDDGRTSLAYTADSLLIRTPFETETILGQTAPLGLQQPVHTISITSQPPIWARYWRLVRTAGPDTFIQLLIQQVNTVTVANEASYLDLVVGSLFTYQKIHPDTILAYQFTRGDRLRLISNENTAPPTFYTPFFETEILSYSIDTEEYVDAGITCDGTNEVQPDKPVDPNYIGKYIIINEVQRLIQEINGNKYVLDYAINTNYVNGTATSQKYPDYRFKDTRGIIRIKLPPTNYTVVSQSLVEVYRPQSNVDNENYQNFFDVQMKFEVGNYGLPNRFHRGNISDQDGTSAASLISTPAVIQNTNGDSYVRNRALPSNNQDPNPQVIIDRIADPNFSDFYVSNLYNLGRVYPQDRGIGVVTFGSRARYSNSYIQDTQINGLNDFDEQDRMDYNDPYGDTIKTFFKNNYLYFFKQLKTAWSPVKQKIIVDNAGNETLATSDNLLNDLMYAEWEGGIGDNAEGFVQNGDYMYIPSANSGVFLRIAQNGSIPISSLYYYDKRAREVLAWVNKYKLRINGGYDRENDEVNWTVPPFIQYLYNNQFNSGDWQTQLSLYPSDTVWIITQQPANSTVALVGGQFEISNTTVLGNDNFKFQGTLSAGGTTPIITVCFTVVPDPNRATTWVGKSGTTYCMLTGPNNNGLQGYTVLSQEYQDDNSLTGFQMPNIQNISPEAIVPNSNTITFNVTTSPDPAGGSDNDIWYNLPDDQLYKNVGGLWSLLADRVINANYVPPVQNLTDCPIPAAVIGILVVDVYPNSTANLCGYVSTPGLIGASNIPAYTGNNFVPNYGVSGAANCYILASDVLTGPPMRRFEFNITKLINDFPSQDVFTFVIAGRDTAANTLAGQYVKFQVGSMVMGTAAPGGYEPTVTSPSIAATSYTSAAPMATGADGTFGIGVGEPILTFTYTVSTNILTES